MSTVVASAVDVLLAVAVGLTFLCAVGVAKMRDPIQRLHFIAPAAALVPWLVALAVWLDGGDAPAILKSLFVALVLAVQNAVVSHATARAVHVRAHRNWPPRPDALERSSGAKEELR